MTDGTDVTAGSAVPAVPAVRVGVRLKRVPEPVGEWLADAGAFDAGGADSLWVDLGAESELDVVAVAGALAAVTFRARLVVAFPDGTPDRTIDTISKLCQRRLAVIGDSAAGGSTVVFRRQRGEPGVFVGPEGRFVPVPVPQGRESWRAACVTAVERHGASGVIVPADQRLLDILRNPEPGGRQDLQLAQG